MARINAGTTKLTDNQVATLLRDAGEQENHTAGAKFSRFAQHVEAARVGTTRIWQTAIADALIWAEYAEDSDAYISQAVIYLQSGRQADLVDCRRFGKRERIDLPLEGWFQINTQMRLLRSIDLLRCGAAELCDLQQEAIAVQSQRKYLGIGAWFLFGPFKIIAVARPELWTDTALDYLQMPPGRPAVKGAKKLLRMGYSFGSSLTPNDLSDTETSFDVSRSTSAMLQNWSQLIAASVSCPLIHINTGLHLLGDGKISV